MRDFSIDLESEKIHSHKTKDYFQEVIKSYYNDNYRSAIVMLFSVTLCDLMLKLIDLKDIYNDQDAVFILDEVEKIQTNTPTSPVWESKLIELVHSKTNLFGPSDYVNITHLQKHRHLCAHPIITRNLELFQPNKETVRAHIRNILEAILIKPPMLSRKIFDDLLADIADNSAQLDTEEKLERYLNAKYFRSLNEVVERQIFRSLWRVVFVVDNDQANENRGVLFRVIKLLLKRNYNSRESDIKSDQKYFSKSNKISIKEIVELLNYYPSLYGLLDDEAHIIIEREVALSADLKLLAWFINGDLREHISLVKDSGFFSEVPVWGSYLTSLAILEFSRIVRAQIGVDESNDILIRFFIISDSFETADGRYINLIKNHLREMNEAQLSKLIRGIDFNSQIYHRRQASVSNREIWESMKRVNPAFNFSAYRNFLASIGM